MDADIIYTILTSPWTTAVLLGLSLFFMGLAVKRGYPRHE